MKAPAFDYVRVRSLDEALSLLGEHGEEAKIIAGGQSLVPALNLRLLAPSLLIDMDSPLWARWSLQPPTFETVAVYRGIEAHSLPAV